MTKQYVLVKEGVAPHLYLLFYLPPPEYFPPSSEQHHGNYVYAEFPKFPAQRNSSGSGTTSLNSLSSVSESHIVKLPYLSNWYTFAF
jgi:hypothetical protein